MCAFIVNQISLDSKQFTHLVHSNIILSKAFSRFISMVQYWKFGKMSMFHFLHRYSTPTPCHPKGVLPSKEQSKCSQRARRVRFVQDLSTGEQNKNQGYICQKKKKHNLQRGYSKHFGDSWKKRNVKLQQKAGKCFSNELKTKTPLTGLQTTKLRSELCSANFTALL